MRLREASTCIKSESQTDVVKGIQYFSKHCSESNQFSFCTQYQLTQGPGGRGPLPYRALVTTSPWASEAEEEVEIITFCIMRQKQKEPSDGTGEFILNVTTLWLFGQLLLDGGTTAGCLCCRLS